MDDGGLDADMDYLSNYMEFAIGTNPLFRDTDGGGVSDYDEYYSETEFGSLDPLDPSDDHLFMPQ